MPKGGYIPNAGNVGNMGELLKSSGFGSDIADSITKTSKNFQGQTVYRVTEKIDGVFKRGDQLYLDAQHMNHLEVFNKNNQFVKVLNLDGTLNRIKTDAGEGRTLK